MAIRTGATRAISAGRTTERARVRARSPAAGESRRHQDQTAAVMAVTVARASTTTPRRSRL